MKSHHPILSGLTLLLVLASSCSTRAARPQLYPNDHYKKIGEVMVQKEVDACLQESESYFQTAEGEKVLKNAQPERSVGSSIGFGFGTGTGNGGGGVGVGMGASGPSRSATAKEIRKSFVNKCLENKGFQVFAWD